MKEILEALAAGLGVSSPKEFVDSLISEEGNPKEGYKKVLKAELDALKKNKFDEGEKAGESKGKKQGKGWAEREFKETWEGELAEKLGVEKDSVEKMTEAFKEKVTEAASQKEITEQDVLNHPSHQRVIKNLKKDLTTKDEELTTLKKKSELNSK